MIARLVWIETRRNIAIWLVPVILVFAWWLLSARGWIPILWRSTNGLLLEPVLPFATPAIAGTAAWMAGRERRRGTGDLLATTPAPPLRRSLATWFATAAWGFLPCLIFAAFLMGWTALVATWGGPDLWAVPTMLVTIVAFSAWGYAIGAMLPSRLTAPAVAVGCFAVVLYLTNYMQAVNGGYQETWVTNLAPDRSNPDWAAWHVLLYAGLAGVGLALLALHHRRGVVPGILIVTSLAIAIFGAGMMRQAWIDQAPSFTFITNGGAPAPSQPEIEQSVEPRVCRGEQIEVCVHPKYKPLLSDAVEGVNRLAEPLIGLPGVPETAGPRDASFTGGASRSFFDFGVNARLNVDNFANRLVADDTLLNGNQLTNPAQIAIRSWLVERADIESYWRCDDATARRWSNPGMPTDETCAAASRFASLSEPEQRTWLEANYAALRAGELGLDDLP